MLWRTDTLLSGDSVNSNRCLVTAGKHGNNTRAIARQLLGKRVPEAMDENATVEVLLDCNNGNAVFFRGSCRNDLSVVSRVRGGVLAVVGIEKSSAQAAVTRGPERGKLNNVRS
jgi:hypothetical protein